MSQKLPYLFVATTGGHLAQLAELERRIGDPSRPRIWVTFDSPQSQSILKGKQTRFIPPIGERDLPNAIRSLTIARRILSENRPVAVFSTGSAIAVPFLNVATLLGTPAHYIESAARVSKASLTGRILSLNPQVRLYRQYEQAPSSRWKYAGSVFDTFEAVETPDTLPTPIRKIVVTLGTGSHRFDRLVRNLKAIIPPEVEVLWQTGCTPLAGEALSPTAEVPSAELDREMARADVVIGHSGCGTALGALNAGKIPLLAPRTVEHGELVDDHQREIGQWLSARELAVFREPGTITWYDVCIAAQRRSQTRVDPPPLRLAVQ